jgi:phage tail P2-like protein
MNLLPNHLRNSEKLVALASICVDHLNIQPQLAKLKISDFDSVISEFLDFLAWQYHVDEYRPDMSDSHKREAIKGALERHKIKGTPMAVGEALIKQGLGNIMISQLWSEKQYNPDMPLNRFSVECSNPNHIDTQAILLTIAAYKNARSKLHHLKMFKGQEDARVSVRIGVRVHYRIYNAG